MTEKTDTKKTLLRVWSGGGSRYVVVNETEKQADFASIQQQPTLRAVHTPVREGFLNAECKV